MTQNFTKIINESKAKAEKANENIPEIQRLIDSANNNTAEANEEIGDAQRNVKDANDIADRAMRTSSDTEQVCSSWIVGQLRHDVEQSESEIIRPVIYTR